MNFFKVGATKFVKLSKNEQEALDREIKRAIVERMRTYELDRDSSLLWLLHTEFGMGPKRLRRVWENMYESGAELCKRYELSSDDGTWLCLRKLRDCGVDLEAWYKEKGCYEDL